MKAVFCLASGASLTRSDADQVRAWRAAGADRSVIVVNTTFRMAPWADVLYAMDAGWWKRYLEEIKRDFQGELMSQTGCLGLPKSGLVGCGNSGAGAILLAQSRGAQWVGLLGYDCHRRGGSHWHGDHPKGLGNCGSMPAWPSQFEKAARKLTIEVVNCSPGTALQAFRTASLADALCSP